MPMPTDGPILVAPRPVRLANAPYPTALPGGRVPRGKRLVSAPVDLLERMHIKDDPQGDGADDERSVRASPLQETSREGSVSPLRTSPGLAAEAWEEFLSVLKPAMDQPFGPAGLFAPFRASSSFSYDRTYRISPRLLSDMPEESRSSYTPPSDQRTRGGLVPLGSPVSRKQTRNPFQRHPSYEAPPTMAPVRWSPVARPAAPLRFVASELSPHTVPLPSPTSSEILD